MVRSFLTSFIIIPAIILAGGGLSFLQRPMGIPLVCLWEIWWISMRWSLKQSPSISQHPLVSYVNSWALLLLIIAPPWEYIRFHGPIPRDTAASWVGVVIFGLGIGLQLLAINALGQKNATHNDPLVTKGVYRYIRHPIYLGNILCFFGIILMTSSFLALFATIWLGGVILWKIPLEERDLAKTFGEAYLEYSQKTKRLIPGLY